MKLIPISLLAAAFLFIGQGCMTAPSSRQPVTPNQNTAATTTNQIHAEQPTQLAQHRRVDFSIMDDGYRFNAEIPSDWEVEYVPAIKSINIYAPRTGEKPITQSRIFIRTFEAGSFLTLSTVDILKRETDTINGHDAVRYTIKKKPGIADFPGQPAWRNHEHRLIDIRYRRAGLSPFYVFSYDPALDESEFDRFITSIVFYNDLSSIAWPMDRADERITKKPFGIYVTPENSPISPERFSGYHTGVDFETFPEEQSTELWVHAVCGGPLRDARQVSGYGGVAIQECEIGDDTVTVVYGHLALERINPSVGSSVAPRTPIGVLGEGYRTETDGERKHLHLGIHKGSAIHVRGYVQSEHELREWIDFETIAP